MPVNSILGVFAKSPIKPILTHIDKVASCSGLLIPFFEASRKQDWIKAEEIRKELSTREKSADGLKRELHLRLPKGLFMPIARGDLIELAIRQDKIANTAKDIAGRVLGRKIQIPEEIAHDFMAYLERCLEAVQQAKKAINELDELLEAGFKGREVDIVTKMLSEIEAIEDDTDSLQIKLRRELFAIEQHYNPVDVMFLYQIIEWVGRLADHSESIGDQLELMLVRS
ncbi:MAG TPA: TIGR00153 family protein [Psychromonas sp.]